MRKMLNPAYNRSHATVLADVGQTVRVFSDEKEDQYTKPHLWGGLVPSQPLIIDFGLVSKSLLG